MEKPKPLSVITLEDDASYTETLKLLLEANGQYQVVQSFRNPVHFLCQLPNLVAEVFLLDVNLPKLSGVQCVSEVRREHPTSRILILTVHDSDAMVLDAFLGGADGYLLKDESLENVHLAIQEAVRGGAPMSASIARKVVRLLGQLKDQGSSPDPQELSEPSVVEKLLTSREYEILILLSKGDRYKDIAAKLHVTVDTVKTHIRHIYEKLHVRNKAEAVARLLS